MANDSAVVIDLSNYRFAGEPAPAADALDELFPGELADLLEVLDEVEGEGDPVRYNDEFTDAAEQFDAAFTAGIAAEQAREDTRAAAVVEDMIRPARRMEDKIARAMHRAADGVYGGQQADFTAEAAALEITLANGGSGPCGPVDDFGRCASRFHALGCAHDVSTDWLAREGGPPRSTYAASLANFASDIELTGPRTYGDPDDDEPGYPMPAATVELAAALADGACTMTPGRPRPPTRTHCGSRPRRSAWPTRCTRASGWACQSSAPSYPGVAQLARDMGLK